MDREQYLDRVHALLPALRERAAECERLRRVPDETFKEFQAQGLLRALQPKAFGGFELDPWTFYEGVIAVSGACASSGWVLGVLGVHNWQMGLFDERAQREVWGDDSSLQISSSYAPTGKVERVDGGFRLSGRWSFSSGCDHAQWVFLGGVAPGDGPVADMRTFLVSRRDYAIDDTWHVSGLCGTGSKDIVISEAFVPEHHTHRMADGFLCKSPGQALNDGPLYRLSFGCVFANAIAMPAIGVARGALDFFRGHVRSKVSALDRSKSSDDPAVQARVADAAAEIDAAQMALERDWRELWAFAEAGQGIPLPPRVRCRADAARAVQRGVHAVDRMFEAGGGRSIYLDNPLQRMFRDAHAMRAHAFNNPDKAARMFGRWDLAPDAPPTDPGDLLI
jgi:3-hydroxy-9,10-secoandrosta-1,3,5(10)-triene-9,17-dione monooxygenase